MTFNLKDVATEYVNSRFTKASVNEKQKIINDWLNKVPASKFLVEDFKRRIGEPKEKRIIDVGCGNGGVSIAFAMAGAVVSGVDIEGELISIAKKHALMYDVFPDFMLYDGVRLPFANETFDYAISTSVLEHTSDPVHYLGEIFRVLKRGGVLYLGFPNKYWPKETHTGLWFLTYTPRFLRDKVVSFFKKNSLEDNNLHFYSYFDLLKMITKLNLEANVSIISETGNSPKIYKKVISKMLASIGISYKVFLAHILVLLKKNGR